MAMLWPFISQLTPATRLLPDRSSTAVHALAVWELWLRGHAAILRSDTRRGQHANGTIIRPRCSAFLGRGKAMANDPIEATRPANGVHDKTRPTPCLSPPSLSPHPCPIPVIPYGISVKRPKDGTLSESCRQTIGKKALLERVNVGGGLGLASELSANSMWTRIALHVAGAHGGQSETTSSVHGVQNELRRASEEIPVIGAGLKPRRPTAVRSPFQNIQESCVCTHAMAPAHFGLGLALGLMVMLFMAVVKEGIAQQRFSVSGKVIAAASGTAIEGATVTNKRTRIHAVTSRLGEYRIAARPDDVLGYSFVGYVSTQEEIGGRERIIVALDSAESMLDVVEINAGYYATTDKYRTGNIGRVTAAELDKQPVSNPLLALYGRVPGVVITQQSGVPGTSIRIQIRGQNSLRSDGNFPLYVIDGVPVNSEPVFASNSGLISVQGMDVLNTLNPQQIKSIEILKDADATAIYGSRGANGVVLITTKQGISGKPKLDISLTSGFSDVPKLPMLNTEAYLEMRREAFANDGLSPRGADLLAWDENGYTDWQEVLLGNTARMTNAQLALSGGQASGTTYRLSGGWRDEDMVFPGDMGHRLGTVGLNLGQRAYNDRLHLTLQANYGVASNRTSPHNLVQDALRLAPNAPAVHMEDGTLNWADGTWTNPFAALERKHTFTQDNLNVSSAISYNLLDGFAIKANLGFSTNETQMLQINPISASNPSFTGATGNALQGRDKQRNWQVEPQLLYSTDFGTLALDALVGGAFQSTEHEVFQLMTFGYINDALIGNTRSASSMLVSRDDFSQYRYAAVFARVGLTWRERYLLNLTGRRDGSSRFGPGKRFGNFGAIGAAWVVSNEAFMKSTPAVSFLKLRGSYGTTGNDRIGDYAYMDTYSAGNYRGQTSLSPTQLFNPDYAWEINRKFDAELDVRFFGDRLSLNVVWFRNTSSNQLVQYSLPAITGFGGVLANLPATVENKGWEFSASMEAKPDSRIYWQSTINVSVPRNKLLAYPDIENSTYANTYVVGKSLSVRRVYEYIGLDENGLYQLNDVNGDGRYNIDDRWIHTEVRRRCYGGFQQTVRYREWALQVALEGVVQNGTGILGLTGVYPGGLSNQPVDVLDRWRTSGNDTRIQRYTTLTSQNTNFNNVRLNSNMNIVDASFIRLRNLSISYRLNGEKCRQLGLSHGEIYVHGQNLWTLTGYKGWDADRPGSTYLPTLRTYTLGLRIGI